MSSFFVSSLRVIRLSFLSFLPFFSSLRLLRFFLLLVHFGSVSHTRMALRCFLLLLAFFFSTLLSFLLRCCSRVSDICTRFLSVLSKRTFLFSAPSVSDAFCHLARHSSLLSQFGVIPFLLPFPIPRHFPFACARVQLLFFLSTFQQVSSSCVNVLADSFSLPFLQIRPPCVIVLFSVPSLFVLVNFALRSPSCEFCRPSTPIPFPILLASSTRTLPFFSRRSLLPHFEVRASCETPSQANTKHAFTFFAFKSNSSAMPAGTTRPAVMQQKCQKKCVCN